MGDGILSEKHRRQKDGVWSRPGRKAQMICQIYLPLAVQTDPELTQTDPGNLPLTGKPLLAYDRTWPTCLKHSPRPQGGPYSTN